MTAPRSSRPGHPDGPTWWHPHARLFVFVAGVVALFLFLTACAPSPRLRHITSTADTAVVSQDAVDPSLVEVAYAAVSAAPIWVWPRKGDGWILLTQRSCGSSASWPAQRALNGGVGLIYGRQYRIDCALGAAASVPAPSSGWLYPLINTPCRLPYGGGQYLAPRDGYLHQGIDLARPTGTVVRAAKAGTVIYAGWNGGAGQQVQINHGGGWVTKYNHLSYINLLRVGQWVAQGQHIGSVGNTGRSFGSHLHVELWLNGRHQDPTGILAPRC